VLRDMFIMLKAHMSINCLRREMGIGSTSITERVRRLRYDFLHFFFSDVPENVEIGRSLSRRCTMVIGRSVSRRCTIDR